MAKRRMFSKEIVETDDFIDMPPTAKLLYFYLNMSADDDGFVDKPKQIMRNIGSTPDDLKILIAKQYVISFETGILVIKHWRIHNIIQKDRYKETLHKTEKIQINQGLNGEYVFVDTECIQDVYKMDTECIQDVYKMETQVRLGKGSIGKDRVVESSRVEVMSTTAPPTGKNNVFKHYQENQIQPDINGNISEQIEDFMRDMSEDCIKHAIDKAYESNKRSWAYIKAILTRYRNSNLKTLADVIADEDRRASSSGTSSQPMKPLVNDWYEELKKIYDKPKE